MSKMLRVSKIPPGTTEDALTFYFENTRKSGGGDVEDVAYEEDDHTAIITFEEDDVVQRVLKKTPLLFQGKVIEVEAHMPDSFDEQKPVVGDAESDGNSFAVHVSGFDHKKVSVETLQLYFESRRGADTDITSIEIFEENAYILKFEEEEAVDKILEKTHKIGGRQLTVKKYVPPPPLPKYEDKVFIKGISASTTKDSLFNFLEAKSNGEPTDVINGEEEGTALVTFKTKPDIEKLRQQCKKRTLEGNYLQVDHVTVTDTIVVTGFKETTSDETLELYFDSKKKCGVDGVTKVKMNKEDNQCFISFEDYNSVEIVCNRHHKVDGAELRVRIHQECLGNPTDEIQGLQFQQPDPLVLENVDELKLVYLKESTENQQKMNELLRLKHARINWLAVSKDEKIEVICTLETTNKDCRKLAKAWSGVIQKEITTYFQSIEVVKLNTIHEALEDVMKSVASMSKDNVIIRTDKDNNTIVLVGKVGDTKMMADKISFTIKDVEKEIDEKKSQIEDIFRSKPFETSILHCINFQSLYSKTVDGVEVVIDKENNVVKFTGKATAIALAKMKMFEKTREIVERKLDEVSEGMIKFLEIPEVKSNLEKSFSESGLTATWNVADGRSFKIYSISDEELVKAIQLFRKSLSEVKINVEDGQASILKTQSWEDLIKATQCSTIKKVVKIEVTVNKIIVYTTSAADTGMIRETLQDFLYKNAIKQQKIDQPGAVSRLLKEHYGTEIASIERDLKNEHVKIQINATELILKGNNTGLSKANARINTLLKSIVEKKHVINKAGIVQHIQSFEGKAKITQVERTYSVVFTVNDKDDQSTDTKIIPQSLPSQRETATCTIPSGQSIITVVGDITELGVDVIVNAANKTLDHVGGLAEVIVKKGGQIIQKECTEYIRKRLGENELLPGEIFCSTAGNLKCQLVVHAVGPTYQDGFHNEDEYLSECIEQSLQETARRKFKSIAMPAIGTGNFGYPVNDACKEIVDSIKRFFKSNRSTSIQKIYLCDLKENTLKSFVTVLQAKFDRKSVKEIGQSIPRRLRQHKFEDDCAGTLFDDDTDDDNEDDDNSQPFTCPIIICVIRGQLAIQEVDVIVNSTSKDLQLTHGAVSQSLLNAGGKTLQSECTKKYPKGVNPGEIAVTGGGKLECKSVYHGALNGWSSPAASKELEMFMTNCLAAAAKAGFCSVAFPALGTGNLGYPKSEVAKMMFTYVEMFGRNNPTTSIRDVRFVIYDKDTDVLKAFEDEKQYKYRRQMKRKSKKNIKKKKSRNKMEQCSLDFDHATLKVYQGDICALDVSAVVNCTNGKFVSKSGSVSDAIIRYGGDPLARELKTQAKNMKKEKIAMTTAGRNFASEFIIHLDVEDSSSDVKSKIKLVIEKLEEFDQHCVAFPANELGEIQKVSAAFVDVLQDFNGKTDIDVHIVLNDGNMIQTFVTCLENSMSGDQNPSLLSKFAGWIGLGGKTTARQKRNIQISNVSLKATVYIKVFAKTEPSANSAITALENSLESAFQEKTVDDELIKDLSKTQIEDLQQILGNSGVEISLKKNLGRIKITGLPENISNALQEIYSFLRRTEEMRYAEEHANLVSEMVQWCFLEVEIDGEKLIEYPRSINLLLEQSVRNNKSTAEFHDDNGNKYIVDFNSYQEYMASNPSEAVNVIRKSKLSDASGVAIEMPSNWSPMDDKENIKLVVLQSTDKEYLEVSKEFKKTTGTEFKIVKISRIQNRTLYQHYKVKKMSMESSNPKGHKNERILWHGTAYEALDSINTYGFNRSYCGKNATIYGYGVYFARDASYSARGTYSPQDHNNQRHMYMCKVLTGEFAKGVEKMIVPPPKGTSHILHDCVVDDPADPGIFVIFHDAQAYPEYLVLFEE